MEDTEFQRRLQGVAAKLDAPQQAQPQAQPQAPAEELPSSDPRKGMQANGMPAPEPGLGDPTSLDAITGGSLKAIFESKDFLFGDTAPERQSDFRRNVEETVDMRAEESTLDGFAAGIAQFATSMIGLGKLSKAAQGIKAVGAAAQAVEASRKGRAALEIGKAALAGATAFDPHDQRLSNLVQDTPFANPINAWLAADPEDSAAEGRLKAALESIGLDVTLGTVFMGAGAIWKALKRGDNEAASKLATELQENAAKAIDADEAAQAAPAPAVVDPEVSPAALDPEAPPAAATVADEATVDVTVTDTPTSAAEAVGGDMKAMDRTPAIKLTDENTKAVYEGMVADTRAIATHGGDWTATVENGHVFGKGEGVPYQKLNNSGELEHFVDRITDEVSEQLSKAKGGVVSDKALSANAEAIVKLYGLDPAEFVGVIQKAGREANQVAAKMEAGFIVSNRIFQDAYALSIRNMMGDYSAFGGSAAAADEALRQRLSMAASVYGATKALSSNAGRTLRRMRGEFGVDQDLVASLGTMDPAMLRELVANTGGNPKRLAKIATATKLTKTIDFLQFLYINNLVSGPKTQLINLATNSYMVGVRPLERILGGALTGQTRLVKESLKQYSYMGNAAYEGFQLAVQAFKRGDSILTPHKSELYIANNLGGQAGGAGSTSGFKPWNNIPNVTGNALRSVGVGIGVPTRMLGTVDELMKQTTYRSMVSSKAYFDGLEKGMAAGLTGKPLKAFTKQYVDDALDNAFDAQGRGTNAAALHEANVATFQNELLPQTWGKTFQSMVTAHPSARIVLPFIKTPTNVIRYGIKMTPGLNLLQGEYRQMLRGELGEAAKAQAIGQLAMGTLFTASAGYMVAQGSITGAGPSEREAAAAWRATGAMPYSFVVENEDGSKTYIPYGRFDPIAIPLGIIADLQDALSVQDGNEDIDTEIESAITALTVSMAAQFRNKAYLLGVSQMMEAVAEPGTNGEKLQRYMGQITSNFVPFSSALRQFNGDPYLREARSMSDKVLTTIPGLGEGVPARHDAWGDPILGRKGLWTSDKNDIVDQEMQRLAMTGFSVVGRPTPYHDGLDLRDIVMSDGKNAYEVYAGLTGHLPGVELSLKDQVRRLMETEAYQQAPDGDMTLKGTKLWMLHTPVQTYRAAAMRILQADPVVREKMMADKLKIMDFYKQRPGSRTSASPAPSPSIAPKPQANPLGDVGEAFGIDLDGLLGPKQ